METGRYEFEVEFEVAPEGEISLIVNNARVEKTTVGSRSFYPFDVGFYAGSLELVVLEAARVLHTLTLEVDPDVAKLTRQDYAEMLADLARSTTALYRLSGLGMPAPVSIDGTRSSIVFLELVRASIDELERAILKVAAHPNRRLAETYHDAPILRVRRADDQALARAVRSRGARPATSLEQQSLPRLVSALGGRWVAALRERRAVEEFDVYENRAVLGFLCWLGPALGAARAKIESDATIALTQSVVWLDRIRGWSRRIDVLRRNPAFQGLRPDPVLRSTSVFRMQPEYARLFTLMSRLRSGLGGVAQVVPALPLERTFALYEMWVYVRVLLAASQRFPASQDRVRHLLRGLASPQQLGASLSTGHASTLHLAPDVTLTYQRRFAVTPDAEGCQTGLIEAVPDIVLSRTDAGGQCIGLIVLDPKYRGGASLLDGVRDLHAYRDAIRAPDSTPLVLAAAALAPRPFEFDETKLWAGAPYPGVVKARPGLPGDLFQDLLENALKRLSSASGSVSAQSA